MKTGTIVYVKEKKLFKERITFIGMIVIFGLIEKCYYFKYGKIKVTNYNNVQIKYKNKINTVTLFDNENSINKRIVAHKLTTLHTANFKYKFIDSFLMKLNSLFHIEVKLPKKTLQRNGYIYKADFIQFVLNHIEKEKYNKTCGVKAEELLKLI